MKKVLRMFLVLIVGLFITQNVNAEFYSSTNSLKYDSGGKWIEAGTSYTYNALYIYKCASNGTAKYNKIGVFPGSIDPQVNPERFKCDDGQTPTITAAGNGCTSNNTCISGPQYYCIVTSKITCPPRKNTTTTTTTTVRTTKSTTRAKTNGTTQKKTTKSQVPTTQTPTTAATTQIVTEPVTNPISNNATIKSISLNKKNISYKSSKNEYKVKIAYGVKVDVEVELEDEKATYKVEGADTLDDEKSEETITITAIAEDGVTTNVVTIVVMKYKPSETDCTLANIYVKDYSINYEANTFDYTLTLGKDVNVLDIETVKQYESQIVNVQGNEKLKNKSKIVVEVESPSGDICTYTIKVKKNSSAWKYIIIIFVLLAALGIAGYFLYRYINKSNGLYKYE